MSDPAYMPDPFDQSKLVRPIIFFLRVENVYLSYWLTHSVFIICQECNLKLDVLMIALCWRNYIPWDLCLLTKLPVYVVSYRVERDGDESFLPAENFTFDVRVDTDSRQV